jgi:hypothetical protein
MIRNFLAATIFSALIVVSAMFFGCAIANDESSILEKTGISDTKAFPVGAVMDVQMDPVELEKYEQQKAAEAEAEKRKARFAKFQVGDYSDTLMIGDSIMVLSSWSLEDYLPGITIDACSGRTLENGGVAEGGSPSDGVLDHIRALDQTLYTRYVIGTGNNDGFGMQYEDGLEIVSALGKDCEIWFVTEFVSNNSRGTANTNAAIARLADEYDNVRIVDWYAAVSPSPSSFLADNCHPGTQEACNMYAKLVKDALDSVTI